MGGWVCKTGLSNHQALGFDKPVFLTYPWKILLLLHLEIELFIWQFYRENQLSHICIYNIENAAKVHVAVLN